MAAKGTVEKTVDRIGDMVRLQWYWTANADGDVDENGSGDVEFWFNLRDSLTLVGVHIIYLTAANGYDVYVRDHYGVDILKGLGVGLVNDAGDAGNMFCPLNAGQELVAAAGVYGGMPITLWDTTLEIVVDDAGDGTHGYVELFFKMPSNKEI